MPQRDRSRRKLYDNKRLTPFQAWLLCGMFAVLTVVGSVLMIVGSEEYYDGYHRLTATVINSTENPDTCYRVDRCGCEEYSGETCTSLQRSGQEGWCSNGEMCCSGSRRLSILRGNVTRGRELGYGGTGYYGTTTYRSSGSSCRDIDNNKCHNTRGICYEPVLTLEYEYNRDLYTGRVTGSCGFEDRQCIDNILGSHLIGDEIPAWIKKTEPTKVTATEPSYSPDGGAIALVVVGSVFTALILVLICCMEGRPCICCPKGRDECCICGEPKD